MLVVSHLVHVWQPVRLGLGVPSEPLFRMEIAAASASEAVHDTERNATGRLLNDTSYLR